MPRDSSLGPIGTRVHALNARYRHHAAAAVLDHALRDPLVGRVALVSSFGAESVVLLHMISVMAPQTPVLFIDTMMLFPETLDYQRDVSARLGLRDVRVIRAAEPAVAAHDPEGLLHGRDPDACCHLRKTAPLEQALSDFDAWISGRKRFHGASRAELEFFEQEDATARIKINPLAHWGREDLAEYITNNRLPRHPLVARGYPSIGCAPCTAPATGSDDPRAGRWPGREKTECGIHFAGGKLQRPAPAPQQEKTA